MADRLTGQGFVDAAGWCMERECLQRDHSVAGPTEKIFDACCSERVAVFGLLYLVPPGASLSGEQPAVIATRQCPGHSAEQWRRQKRQEVQQCAEWLEVMEPAVVEIVILRRCR